MHTLTSLPAIVAITTVYWVLLLARTRVNGRRQFDRAFEQAAAAAKPGEPIQVVVHTKVTFLRDILLPLAMPAALLVARFIVNHG